MAYQQLSLAERYRIAALLETQHSAEAIARQLKRSGNTIRHELKRAGNAPYCADTAHQQARLCKVKNAFRLHDDIWEKAVWPRLKQDWSPEQIAGDLRAKQPEIKICAMSIYRKIAADKWAGGQYYRHLRQRKPYRKRHTKDMRGQIINRRDISERPEWIEKRSRIGDWEVDLVIGAGHQGVMLTIVERRSGLLLSKWLANKSAHGVAVGIIHLLTPFKAVVHTLTSDNGLEFAEHEWVAEVLDADFYFARPYASWQRGSNENANGLLRQYFPKGMAFTPDCKYQVASAVCKLNNRPRKRHDYKTPLEIFATCRSSRNAIH